MCTRSSSAGRCGGDVMTAYRLARRAIELVCQHPELRTRPRWVLELELRTAELTLAEEIEETLAECEEYGRRS